jgi:hypothetical protein
MKRMKRWLALGAILIVVGLAAFVVNLTGASIPVPLEPGLLFLGAIAVACLAGYVYTGWHGLLIPGCVLSSVWLGATLIELVPVWPGDLGGAIFMALLGTSFFAIYLVDRARTGRRRIWPILVGVGLVVFAVLVALGGFLPEVIVGSLFVVVPGLVLLAVYFWRRMYPLLIPACYIIAIGLVIPMLESAPEGTGVEVFQVLAILLSAVGVGSLAIYIIDRLYTRASNWWPLVPALVGLVGGALLGFAAWGMGLTAAQWELIGIIASSLWPLGLIVLGAWLVFRWARRIRRGPRQPAPPEEG